METNRTDPTAPDPASAALEGRATLIAIDGPAGAGKSTLAKGVARELGLAYLNTGLMYRALTARAIAEGIGPDDETRLAGTAAEIGFALGGDDPPSLLIDGRAPGGDLETDEVEAVISRVSRHPAVRAALRGAQRALGAAGGVIEGRDIAAVVFPDADVKIFVTASPEVRAARRRLERGGEAGIELAIDRRDQLDARTSALAPSPGAVTLDTTGLSIEQALAEALRIVDAALERAGSRRGPRGPHSGRGRP